MDAADADEPEAAIRSHGPIHGVVNCVGAFFLKPAHLTSAAEWDQTIRSNLTTAYATVRAGRKALWSSGGCVLMCATAAVPTGLANDEALAAARGDPANHWVTGHF